MLREDLMMMRRGFVIGLALAVLCVMLGNWLAFGGWLMYTLAILWAAGA